LSIITGSAQGLGKAFAIRLLAAGAKVCLSDVNSEVGEETLVELRERFGDDKVAFIRCDVTKKDDLVALYDNCEKHFDAKVEIFCNNAGINSNVAGWRRCMDINIIAAMEAAELVLERMSLEKGGRGGLLVNTASLAGIVPGWVKYLHSYFASKHAVVSMTRTLGSNETFKETGVKVWSFFHIFPLFMFSPRFYFPPGSVHLSLFCRHCNLERPGRGEREQDHAGEDLRHPHRGGGL